MDDKLAEGKYNVWVILHAALQCGYDDSLALSSLALLCALGGVKEYMWGDVVAEASSLLSGQYRSRSGRERESEVLVSNTVDSSVFIGCGYMYDLFDIFFFFVIARPVIANFLSVVTILNSVIFIKQI